MKKNAKGKKLFSGERALVMGLGLHGGGVATAKWLLRHGAKVTATDLRSKEMLRPSIRSLGKAQVRYVLGEHREEDFARSDLIIANPGVPRESSYLAIGKRNGKRIENDASLFFRHATNDIIAVTGTRGKTTTALFIAELLKKKYPKVRPSGNTPDNAFLKEFERVNGKNIPVVAEMSSWQLEYLPVAKRAPRVAVITNLFPDHLNRYGESMEEYALAKANIFRFQKSDDALVLNAGNRWTEFFLAQRPKGRIFFTSTKPLAKDRAGGFIKNGMIILRVDGKEERLFSTKRFTMERGAHNLENLLAAMLAVKLYDPSLRISEADALRLPTPPMRQEIIARKGKQMVVNDSCATSPDGTIAALKRFAGDGTILITGGTDKDLDFKDLAKTIAKCIPPERLILLEGSATKKLHALLPSRYAKLAMHPTLEECVLTASHIAKRMKGEKVLLFSPGAASFEKFLHEFDRGQRFARIVKRTLS